eukprot:366307-Chlamydomonas_euryale.AAC.4
MTAARTDATSAALITPRDASWLRRSSCAAIALTPPPPRLMPCSPGADSAPRLNSRSAWRSASAARSGLSRYSTDTSGPPCARRRRTW